MSATTPSTYFVRTARRVFDDYLAQLGASFVYEGTATIVLRGARTEAPRDYVLGDRNSRTIVRYEHPTWCIEVLYLPTDGPRYAPRVEIGPIPETQLDPRRNRVEVLHTIPEDNDLRRYVFMWEYQSEEELEASLIKVRDLVVEPFSVPFLKDSAQLIALVEERAKKVDNEWRTQILCHNESIYRRLANEAFRRKDYEEVVRNFTKIGGQRLSPVEVKKLELARKRISGKRVAP